LEFNEKNSFLRVIKALPGDMGKGIARIPSEDMKRLGIVLGDIVEIKGRQSTVAKVVPLPQEYQKERVIQIDGIIRRNANVELGDKITLYRVPYQDAKTIVLSNLDIDRLFGREPDIQLIRETLVNMPVKIGDRVKVFLFGQSINFFIKGTSPDGAVIIRPFTEVVLTSGDEVSEKGFKVYYEDIGGLDKEIQKIREIIEYPLKYPKVYSKLGLKAPNGILLYGPPGTGKTLIAKAIASEASSYFIHLNGSEVMNKFYGESEAKLRVIFEDAKQNSPSIIFLDEIDALAPKREQVIGDVEKRVITQLLASMDGIVDRGDVIIIGATNIPDVLDPALRRPGRFDREIMIPVPNEEGRLKILEIHTRYMPLSDDVDLKKIAEMTHGFVGADLASLCREAGMHAFRKIINKNEIFGNFSENDKEIIVSMSDFNKSFKEIEPSALREYSLEISKVKMSDIGGLKKIKQDLISLVKLPLKFPKAYKHLQLDSAKGILFVGPSGTGKTLMAKALANESGVNFITINGPSLFSKWLGESEKILQQIFKKAKQASPCILFFDELDGIAPKRGENVENSSISQRIVSQLLIELDSLESYKSVIVLGATNRPDLLDPALIRSGRFEFIFNFEFPDKDERYEILKLHAQNRKFSKDVDLYKLAEKTEQFSGAKISSICKKAAILALQELFSKNKQINSKEIYDIEISEHHFNIALKEARRHILKNRRKE
jgi:transitional endoplasmic reticulum ATPase